MHVIVTGAAGALARALIPRLCAQAEVARVTGVDVRPASLVHRKFRGIVADIASPEAWRVLSGADALIHLAFILLRGRRSIASVTRTNVTGTQMLLRKAADAGVEKLMFLSSAAVYGAGVELAEGAPFDPLPGFLYARNKAECERWLAADLPQAVVLRPHIILGPHALPLLRRLADSPLRPRLPDPQPRLQCVHADDVAAAIIAALQRDARGPFNLAAPASFSLRELIGMFHPHAVAVPLPLLRAGLTIAWALTGWAGEPGWLEGVGRTLTLDCSRARAVLGWQPQHRDWREILRTTLG
jgi:UDP-glucose 4-epimerase